MLLRLLPLLVFGAFAVVMLVGLYSPKSSLFAASSMEGMPLPEIAPVPLDGLPSVTLDSLKGQPYLLNVFASWCSPCRAEHGLLKELSDQGIPVVGIAWQDRAEAITQWFAEDGNPYRMVGLDGDGSIATTLGITGVPESFVVGADGTILFHLAGPLDEAWIQQHVLPAMAGKKP